MGLDSVIERRINMYNTDDSFPFPPEAHEIGINRQRTHWRHFSLEVQAAETTKPAAP